jgi:hypothetical protein
VHDERLLLCVARHRKGQQKASGDDVFCNASNDMRTFLALAARSLKGQANTQATCTEGRIRPNTIRFEQIGSGKLHGPFQ